MQWGGQWRRRVGQTPGQLRVVGAPRKTESGGCPPLENLNKRIPSPLEELKNVLSAAELRTLTIQSKGRRINKYLQCTMSTVSNAHFKIFITWFHL